MITHPQIKLSLSGAFYYRQLFGAEVIITEPMDFVGCSFDENVKADHNRYIRFVDCKFAKSPSFLHKPPAHTLVRAWDIHIEDRTAPEQYIMEFPKGIEPVPEDLIERIVATINIARVAVKG